MKILCPVKRVIDYQVKIRVRSDHTGVETTNVPHSTNPFDEIALEEGIRLREQGLAKEVIAVTIGAPQCSEILRKALAHGADHAILIETDESLRPAQIAHVLKAAVMRWQPDCVLMGKQAIDDDCNQTGQYLAGLLDWPQATFASNIQVADKQLTVTREVDAGLETLQLSLPAVITVDLRLNEPRYLSLPNIVKAKQKTIEVIPLAEFGVDTQSTIITLSVTPPPARDAGVRVESVAALIDYLRNTAAVLS